MRDGLEGIRRLDGVRREELVGRPTDGAGDIDEVKTPTSDAQGLVPPAPELGPRPPARWSGLGPRSSIEAALCLLTLDWLLVSTASEPCPR